MDTPAPTRMNLLARRAQRRLAADGAVLLKGKREALMKELIARARDLARVRRELHRRGRASVAALAMARAVTGTPQVRSATLMGQRQLDVRVTLENVWGVELMNLSHGAIVREPRERGIGILDVCSHVLEAAQSAEHMLETLLESAAIERNILVLSDEVKKVTRRVNALEEAVIPRLDADVRAIARIIDERERQDLFRLKRLKHKQSRGNHAHAAR